MKKGMFKVLCLLVLVSFVFSACGSGQSGKESSGQTTAAITSEGQSTASTAASNTPVTFTFFCEATNGTPAGIYELPVAKEIEKLTGVTLDITIGDGEKFKVLAAGGDLPDIISFLGDETTARSLVNSKQVIALNGLLDQHGQNIAKRIPEAIQNSKDKYGEGKDVYYLYGGITRADMNNPNNNGWIGFFTRYDLYKAVGAPEMKNEDEFLATLKKMVEYQPTASNGKKVYALSGWIDSGLWPYIIPYPFSYGYYTADAETANYETGKYERGFSDENSIFWRSVKFHNKAYQMGIMDPEAFTMKNDQYTKKVQNGEVLCSPAGWITADPAVCGEDANMYVLPGPFPVIPGVYAMENPFGTAIWWARAITSNCEDPERAMQFLNFCDSDEGSRLLFNGVKGKHWDVVDGKAQLIGDALKKQLGDTSVPASYLADEGIAQLRALVSGYWTCEDGESNYLFETLDLKTKIARPVDKEFAQKYAGADAVFPGQAYSALVNSGKAKTYTSLPLAMNIMDPLSDASNQIYSKVNQYLNANIGKIVLSKTDADFDAAKKKAISDINAMGLDKYEQEFEAIFEKAVEKAKNYK